MEMTKHEEISEKMENSGSKNHLPTACSWPTISGCISVKTPSIGSTQTSASDYCGDHLYSNCDSGYSEPDICTISLKSDNFENFNNSNETGFAQLDPKLDKMTETSTECMLCVLIWASWIQSLIK